MNFTEDGRFRAVIDKVIELEGGYVNDPDDPGGETRYGISKRSYPDIEIRDLTREDAREIYYRDFWVPNRYREIEDHDLREKAFDLAVNMGAKTANIIFQLAVQFTGDIRISIDGIVGPETLQAANSLHNPAWTMDRLKIIAVGHYIAIDRPKFWRGWIRRALA